MVEAYPCVIKDGAMENTSLNAAAPETGGSTLTHTDLQGGSAGESWKIGATEPLANLGISWIPCDSEMMLLAVQYNCHEYHEYCMAYSQNTRLRFQ